MITRVVLLLLFAALMGALAFAAQRYPPLMVVAGSLAIALTAGLVMSLIEWGVYQVGDWMREKAQNMREDAEIKAITPQTRALELLSHMTPEQIRYADRHPDAIFRVREYRIQQPPLDKFEIFGHRYDYNDINLYLERSNPGELEFCPLRTFSEGSYHRETLGMLTLDLVNAHVLREAAGNKPATAYSWDELLTVLGFETEEK